MLDELENGWYLRAYEHMTSKLHFQKIGALKACRSIEFGRAITFVHIFNGSQDEVRTYTSVENLTSLKAENDRLKEENAKLKRDLEEERLESRWLHEFLHAIARKCGTKDCPSLVAYVKQLEDSNTKLIDQVREMWDLVNHRTTYGHVATLEHMEELGIEVDG